MAASSLPLGRRVLEWSRSWRRHLMCLVPAARAVCLCPPSSIGVPGLRGRGAGREGRREAEHPAAEVHLEHQLQQGG